jgi:hypothetical protein
MWSGRSWPLLDSKTRGNRVQPCASENVILGVRLTSSKRYFRIGKDCRPSCCNAVFAVEMKFVMQCVVLIEKSIHLSLAKLIDNNSLIQ